jgi:hypothetical protein
MLRYETLKAFRTAKSAFPKKINESRLLVNQIVSKQAEI